MEAGILFGREAAKRGVIVLNDPDSLGRAINKLYFQCFPVEARAETLITKHDDDIKAFAKAHGDNIILKPLQGSGGSGVFKLDAEEHRQPQPDDRGDRPRRLHHRPGLCAGGEEGRHPLLPDERPAAEARRQICRASPGRGEGRHPQQHPRRRQRRSGRDRRDRACRSPRSIRPKLVADGMFLVGIDIVGDKILEVNVFSPGNLHSCSELAGVDFSVPILEAIERKVAIPAQYAHAFDNRHLAIL